jgi:dihydroxyacetone kinase-like protein
MGGGLTTEGLAEWMRAFADIVSENAAYLTELDSAIGDADHGTNLDRGMRAVVAALEDEEFGTGGAMFKKVGMTLVSTVGGASGPLYGTFFLRFGAALDNADEIGVDEFAAALRAGVEGIEARGKAGLGDKTMYDALAPAADAFEAARVGGLAEALAAAAAAGVQGRDQVTPVVARRGRASYLGERSAGHQDPGATSATMLLETAAATLS